MFNPWSRMALDPGWDPTLLQLEHEQYGQQSNTAFLDVRRLQSTQTAEKEPLVAVMADIAPPSALEDVSNAMWQPTPNQTRNVRPWNASPSFPDFRMPKIRGRLRVMTSALNDQFAQEKQNIAMTKSYIEEILASDARQLFLRGVMLNDSEIDDGKKTYWMDVWDGGDPPSSESDLTNTQQGVHISAVSDTYKMPSDATNHGNSTGAVTEPSSEIDLQHLEKYKAKNEVSSVTQRSVSRLDPSPTLTKIESKERPHTSLKPQIQSLPAYRTARRRMLLHRIHGQRRKLSDRLDQTEKELEMYGAMRNMEQVWDAAPKFASQDLDDLIEAFSVGVKAQEVDHHIRKKVTQGESNSASIENKKSFPEASVGANKANSDASTLALRINQLRHDSRHTETRAYALASALTLPASQESQGDRSGTLADSEDLMSSQTSSIATATSEECSRRPSTVTNHSFSNSNQDADGCVMAEMPIAENVLGSTIRASTHDLPKDSLGIFGGERGGAPFKAISVIGKPPDCRDGHQSQPSTSTVASNQSGNSALSSHLSHISRVQETTLHPAGEAETTPKAHRPAQLLYPDEETRKLLCFRRELLREWHVWDHIEKCLLKRMKAIRRERARLGRYIALLRATGLDPSRDHQASPPSTNTTTPSTQAGVDAEELLSRQRERARQLGFDPGVIVVNPDTPTNAGAYVVIPPMQQDGTPSRPGPSNKDRGEDMS